MVTYSVLMMIAAAAIVLARKKLKFAHVVIGALFAWCLLGTPVGMPMAHGAQAVAKGIQSAANSIISTL